MQDVQSNMDVPAAVTAAAEGSAIVSAPRME